MAYVSKSVRPSSEFLDFALNGGEDFELLFTAEPVKVSQLDGEIFTIIGDVIADPKTIEIVIEGERRILEPKGYRHF